MKSSLRILILAAVLTSLAACGGVPEIPGLRIGPTDEPPGVGEKAERGWAASEPVIAAREAALKAIKKPVQNLRPYADGVAEKLVEDLSSIKIQMPDGTPNFQSGQYVEPVQLQVVCYGMWENLSPEGAYITEKDLQEVGNVDESLGKYYAARVKAIAAAKNVKERQIREWFGKKFGSSTAVPR